MACSVPTLATGMSGDQFLPVIGGSLHLVEHPGLDVGVVPEEACGCQVHQFLPGGTEPAKEGVEEFSVEGYGDPGLAAAGGDQ